MKNIIIYLVRANPHAPDENLDEGFALVPPTPEHVYLGRSIKLAHRFTDMKEAILDAQDFEKQGYKATLLMVL